MENRTFKKKRIALVGLNNLNNMGDQIIAETGQYLIQKNRGDSIQTYYVDISPYDSICKVHIPFRFKCFIFIKKLERFIGNGPFSLKVLYYLQYYAWKIKLYKYYKHQLDKADAVILSGGAFIKYHTQELNYLVDMITKIALDKGIPVMMSAMGLEGYSSTDPRCQKLKKAINRSCVKMITTRDNLSLLNEKYIDNKTIITALVGDPAFYIPECYKIEKKESNVVGLGVIRSDIFLKYGIHYTEDEVLILYQEIVKELERRNIDWKLFTNGFTSDYQFGLQLLESLGLDDSKYAPRPKNTEDFIKMVSEFDAMIAARLHACMTAYSLNIPAIGLVWNEKLKLFGELIGKQENYIEVGQFHAKYIVNILERNRKDSYDTIQRDHLKMLTIKYLDQFIERFV